MTGSRQSNTRGELQGVLISAESVDRGGECQSYGEFVVTLQDNVIDIRLGDRRDTIWMLDLEKVEEALRQLKRWDRIRQQRLES